MEDRKINSEISLRFMQEIEGRMNKLFKTTLSQMEEESKKFKVDPRFFARNSNQDGFNKVRKSLLDQGNDILNLLEIVLSEVSIVPNKAIVKVCENDLSK